MGLSSLRSCDWVGVHPPQFGHEFRDLGGTFAFRGRCHGTGGDGTGDGGHACDLQKPAMGYLHVVRTYWLMGLHNLVGREVS